MFIRSTTTFMNTTPASRAPISAIQTMPRATRGWRSTRGRGRATGSAGTWGATAAIYSVFSATLRRADAARGLSAVSRALGRTGR